MRIKFESLTAAYMPLNFLVFLPVEIYLFLFLIEKKHTKVMK